MRSLSPVSTPPSRFARALCLALLAGLLAARDVVPFCHGRLYGARDDRSPTLPARIALKRLGRACRAPGRIHPMRRSFLRDFVRHRPA